VNGYATDGSPNRQVFDERAAYHGDIVFNPADGSIQLLTLEADLPQGGLVAAAAWRWNTRQRISAAAATSAR